MRETRIPFPGFYQSILDEGLDSELESWAQYYECDTREFFDAVYMKADYRKAHEYLAEKWVGAFENYLAYTCDLEIDLTYTALVSPREYNFTTDRVFANISEEHIRDVFDKVDTVKLDKVCEDHLKSRDGFSSFYNYRWRVWGAPEVWDHNQLSMLFYALLEENWMWDVYEGVSEDMSHALWLAVDLDAVRAELGEEEEP